MRRLANHRQIKGLLLCASWLPVVCGCAEPERIDSYRVPKSRVLEARHGVKPFGQTSRAPAADFHFTTPEGWEKGTASAFRKAAFVVSDGKEKVDITVSVVGGSILGNINRWCEQVGLETLTQSEMESQVESVRVDGRDGLYVELIGPGERARPEAIFGVIVPQGETAWFLKLRGDKGLAAREQKRFRTFVDSMRFGAAQGASDGK